MKRFYKNVRVGEREGEAGYPLLLDDKPIQTPARQRLLIASLPLAESVANEWRAQGDMIIPDTMPLSQMAMTLVDRIIPDRASLTNDIFNYIDTDLICYRAHEPASIRAAQEEKWDPFVAWFRYTHSLPLAVTYDLNALTQSLDVHRIIRHDVMKMNDAEFMALYLATIGTGSVVMAMGFVAGHFSPEQLVSASFVEEYAKDEIYRSEIYGSAPDQEKRIKSLQHDLNALQLFLILTTAAL